mmetsp:Transcript_13255/g.28364  ORF Transcript_13255/g.28364 Transcript_13255/m.28364 type:complete len:297 (-) Transcript_13255:641-1531(-)|eukprot:CAMPEP_0202900126 /NCGR_PEP_ID=MMETSP1392-20130828/9929_1 /ASSEMBLY_ACC=CAM_ASM_000868 /TAXON_ID=225041 /ORGANISM="Chlamydomonas chlamydogama, Strain SAG 11-48b" /LENGTH=296 /DNA_ID=CAMNT_0049586449 /DNA_START=80 /DNA_END=970 /DNA_ORIENTATION=-
MLLHSQGCSGFRKVTGNGAASAPVVRPQRVMLKCEASSKAKFFVGGNWKTNGTKESVQKLVDGLNAGASSIDARTVDVVVAPTYLHLDFVRQRLDASKYGVAAQNVWLMGTGAYTGEIAAEQLKDLGINWTLTGHSERRSLCGETNEIVAKKTARALDQGMSVIACIGETLEQRNSGQMFPVLDAQAQALVDHVKDWSRVVIAYEPVWAIGTGVVATPQQAQEVHAHLRELLEQKLGRETAQHIRLLYGGSVNDKNCKELATQEDIDGFLVGGASLQAPAFLTIIAAHAAKLQGAR